MYRKSLALVVVAAGVLSGCDGDDPSSPDRVTPEFELTLAGALTETATGPAYFGSDVNDDGEPVFLLLLGTATSRHLVLVGKEGSERPAAGSYDIGDPTTAAAGWSALHLVSEGDELLGMFMAETGTLTITESTSKEMRGTLEFAGTGVFGEEEGELQVTGTFVAAPAPSSALSAETAGAGARIR